MLAEKPTKTYNQIIEGIKLYGISVKALLEIQKAASCSKVTVVSDDSYSAELTAEEIAEEGKAYLMLDEGYLRLVVFGDSNSKRSVSNVVQIIVE